MLAAAIAAMLAGCAAVPSAQEGENHSEAAQPILTVFAGDSLTARCDLKKYYPDITAVNCGMDGDTVAGVRSRLDEICSHKADTIVLLIGANDIIGWSALPQPLCDDIAQLLDEISSRMPKAKLFVQSIYPVNDSIQLPVSWTANDRIVETNSLLQDVCAEHGAVYIDVHTSLCNEANELDERYTLDGVHLSDDGYAIATAIISAAILE